MNTPNTKITTLLFDFSNVLLFANDRSYKGKLNDLHKKLLVDKSQYNALDFFTLNTELLKLLENAKKDYEIHLLTEGSMHQTPEIKRELDKVFTSMHSTKEIGLHKSDPRAFEAIAKIIKKDPQNILFFDDKKENVDAAIQAGLSAVQYSSNVQVRATLMAQVA